jgi:hypothetical protein
MSGTDGSDIDDLIDAARRHGASDPELEITALQDLLRVAWSLMTERQQETLLESVEAQEVLEADEDDELEDPDAG